MRICIYGAASPNIDPAFIEAVENLGEIMASRGHELVFGAGANGLMGAAARGVKRCGGKVSGVIPGFFREEEIEAIFDDCDELTFTEDMRERKRIMESKADAFIIVPGGIGTYEEFFEVLTLKQLGRHNKPLVLFNYIGYYDDLISAMDRAMSQGFIKRNCMALYSVTDDAARAVELAENVEVHGFTVRELKEG